MLEAVVYDFDGTLTDTEPLHFQAFKRLVEARGGSLDWPEYVGTYTAYDDREAFRVLWKDKLGRPLADTERDNLIAEKAELFQQLASASDTLALFPGVEATLRSLHGVVFQAVCTSALRADISPLLDRFGIQSLFHEIVGAEDVPRGKPNPDGYEEVVNRLRKWPGGEHLSGGSCLAIEDTLGGIRAAQAAGYHVLAVTNTHSAEELQEADEVVGSLAEYALADRRKESPHSR